MSKQYRTTADRENIHPEDHVSIKNDPRELHKTSIHEKSATDECLNHRHQCQIAKNLIKPIKLDQQDEIQLLTNHLT